MRRSMAEHRNSKLGNWSKWARTRSNTRFFTEALQAMSELGSGNGLYAIGLVGSCDLPGICLRQAQSVLRNDRRPSYWSHAFIITQAWDGASPISQLPIAEVPFYARNGEFPEPDDNGVIRSTRLGHYLNRTLDANVALFTVRRNIDNSIQALSELDLETIQASINDPNIDRQRFDFWQNLGVWQQYFWSGQQLPNPLLNGQPIATTSFIEMLFEQIGIDLTPAASERNSAPEHFWTSMHWWLQQEVQEQRGSGGALVSGCFAIRDEGAAVLRSQPKR